MDEIARAHRHCLAPVDDEPLVAAFAAAGDGFDRVASRGFTLEAFRTYATSDDLVRSLDAQDAAAPPEIAADVRADTAWVRTRALAVAERYGYDLPRLLREGSAEDLAAFTPWDPAIVDQDRRVVAYQEQVCGAGS